MVFNPTRGGGGSTRPMEVYSVRDKKSDVTYGSGLLWLFLTFIWAGFLQKKIQGVIFFKSTLKSVNTIQIPENGQFSNDSSL